MKQITVSWENSAEVPVVINKEGILCDWCGNFEKYENAHHCHSEEDHADLCASCYEKNLSLV